MSPLPLQPAMGMFEIKELLFYIVKTVCPCTFAPLIFSTVTLSG